MVVYRPVTILCSKHEQSDIEIVETGKLILHSACKAYGARVPIQAQTIMTSDNTDKDIIPHYLLIMIVVHLKENLN
jgi:hypothetical protein